MVVVLPKKQLFEAICRTFAPIWEKEFLKVLK